MIAVQIILLLKNVMYLFFHLYPVLTSDVQNMRENRLFKTIVYILK